MRFSKQYNQRQLSLTILLRLTVNRRRSDTIAATSVGQGRNTVVGELSQTRNGRSELVNDFGLLVVVVYRNGKVSIEVTG